MVQGGGCYSLRDPIEAHGNRSAERWLEAHSKFGDFIIGVKRMGPLVAKIILSFNAKLVLRTFFSGLSSSSWPSERDNVK